MGNIRDLYNDNEADNLDKLDVWAGELKDNAEAIDLLLSEDKKIPELKGYVDYNAHAALGKLSFMKEEDVVDIVGYKDYDPPSAYKQVETKLFSDTKTTQPNHTQPAKTFSLAPLLRIAAACAVLLIATVGVYNVMSTGSSLTTEMATVKQALNLPDGSVITLDGGSELAYDQGNFTNNRVVEFDGRAYFDITKQSGQNFVIKADDLEVEVLGTEFEINVIDGKKEVKVYEGKVRVTQNGKETILIAGEAISNQQKHTIDTTLPSWYTGTISFVKTPFMDAVRTLENHYNVTMSFDQPTTNFSCDLNTEIRNESLQSVLNEIKSLYGGSYKINGDQVTFTGLQCQTK